MTERDRAWTDQRRDVIDEVAAEMPGASAREVVSAIVARLSQELPELVEVVVETT